MGSLSSVTDYLRHLLTHKTKITQVRHESKWIGVTHLLLQLCALLYLVIYVFIISKKYQHFSPLTSTNIITINGLTSKQPEPKFGNLVDDGTEHFHAGIIPTAINLTFDATDVSPFIKLDDESFYVASRMITTNQTRSECPEGPDIKGGLCQSNSDCPVDATAPVGNGYFTGECVNNTGTCRIRGWCPVESKTDGSSVTTIFEGVEKFNITIENFVQFPALGNAYNQANADYKTPSEYKQSCLYGANKNKKCPRFIIQNMLESADINVDRAIVDGAIIRLVIKWDCDFDWSMACSPTYSFEKMEEKHHDWSLWAADYANNDQRLLRKYIGIKFIIEVIGRAGKFDLVELILALGAYAGVFGFVSGSCITWSVICLHKCCLE